MEVKFCGGKIFAGVTPRGTFLSKLYGLGRRVSRAPFRRLPASSFSHPHAAHGVFPFALPTVHVAALSHAGPIVCSVARCRARLCSCNRPPVLLPQRERC